MQPSLNNQAAEPLIEIIEDLAPLHLHAAAWATCSGKNWYFGHGSNDGGFSRFWKMDLDGDGAFNAIWEHVRPRCEAMAGIPLRVIRQYANGHTYGLGGEPHLDDNRPGTFTLLYYPNPEWKDVWNGETVFYDQAGELALSVRLRPNRAIFFDSRILHAGRSPSRAFTGLRVSVAYKLEAAGAPPRPRIEAAQIHAVKTGDPARTAEPLGVEEIARDGAKRVYRARVAEAEVLREVERRLADLAKSVRLPGFRPGKIPGAVLEARYGPQARVAALKQLSGRVAARALPAGSVASACDLLAGADSGDMEIALAATHLPDLPDIDYTQLLRDGLKSQVLDRLDAAYSFPLFPGLIEREFAAIWKLAESEGGIPSTVEERKDFESEFRKIAERRLRLGVLVTELARRYGIQAASGAQLEDRVIDHLIAQASMVERPPAPEKLRETTAG